MRFLTLIITGLVLGGCAQIPEVMAMREVVTPEGWQATAFYNNGILISEEVDTQNDGRPDLWRYYEKGLVVREEFDLNFDGAVDTQKFYDENGVLIRLMVDADHNGSFESITEYDPKKNGQMRAPARSSASTTASQLSQQDNQPEEAQPAQQQPVSAEPATNETGQGEGKLTLEQMFQSNNQQMTTPAQSDPRTIGEVPSVAPIEPVQGQNVAPVTETPPAPVAPAQEENGSIVRPIQPPAGYTQPAPARTGIVPGPIFHHPSEGLED